MVAEFMHMRRIHPFPDKWGFAKNETPFESALVPNPLLDPVQKKPTQNKAASQPEKKLEGKVTLFTDEKGNYETLEALIAADFAGFSDFAVRKLNDKEMNGKVCKARDVSSGAAIIPALESGDGQMLVTSSAIARHMIKRGGAGYEELIGTSAFV
jgi:hypothetical protein